MGIKAAEYKLIGLVRKASGRPSLTDAGAAQRSELSRQRTMKKFHGFETHGGPKPVGDAPLIADTTPDHGTTKRYTKYGCRCQECTNAYSAYTKASGPDPARFRDQSDPKHGTRYFYHKGCRCDKCRRVESDHNRVNYHAKKMRAGERS